MNIVYEKQVLDDLKKLEKLQAHMLIDLFENQYESAKPFEDGLIYKTGPYRILFLRSHDTITVLRVVK